MPCDVADFLPIRGRDIVLQRQRINILSGPALRVAPAKIQKWKPKFHGQPLNKRPLSCQSPNKVQVYLHLWRGMLCSCGFSQNLITKPSQFSSCFFWLEYMYKYNWNSQFIKRASWHNSAQACHIMIYFIPELYIISLHRCLGVVYMLYIKGWYCHNPNSTSTQLKRWVVHENDFNPPPPPPPTRETQCQQYLSCYWPDFDETLK